MDKKITQLTQVTELTGAELLPLAQGGVTKSASVDQLRGYKVYTALLTQSGFDVIFSFSSGPVTKGRTYMIILTSSGADFSNVGGPKYDGVTPINGTYFVAINNDIPNNYGGGQLEYNQAAPVVTVLENTIGNIYWTFNGDGSYFANSDSLFTSLKTTVFIGPLSNSNTEGYSMLGGNSDNLIQEIRTLTAFAIYSNDLLFNTPIEIRVYN
jgi:hypothetical protein